VGSSMTRQVDVRMIATTNRNLEEMVHDGQFRGDLFYRLNVVPIYLPALWERLDEDLDSLSEYFLRRCADRDGRSVRILSKAALEIMKQYEWPGNVRELENLMERISILGTDEVITEETIRSSLNIDPSYINKVNTNKVSSIVQMPENETVSLEEIEKELIEKTLGKYDGHRQKTAQALGIGVRTLGMKIKRWNLLHT